MLFNGIFNVNVPADTAVPSQTQNTVLVHFSQFIVWPGSTAKW